MFLRKREEPPADGSSFPVSAEMPPHGSYSPDNLYLSAHPQAFAIFSASTVTLHSDLHALEDAFTPITLPV